MKKIISISIFVFTGLILSAQNDVEINKIKAEFQKQTPQTDSAYVVLNADSHVYSVEHISEKQFQNGAQNEFFKANVGDVVGPYAYNNRNFLYKIVGTGLRADSVRVRHLLIGYVGADRYSGKKQRTKEQAKNLCDSLLNVIVSGQTKMEDLILNFTDDPGSLGGNLGDYGWFTFESGFVQPFKDAGFNNPKGKTVIVETQFGYHIIQVLDKTQEKHIADIVGFDKIIDPAQEKFAFQTQTEIPGQFPGGYVALQKYFADNLKYPAKEKKNHVEGVVWVMAKIEPDGSIVSFGQIGGVDGHPSFTQEALRLFLTMPKWQACMSGGKPVADVVIIPVVFKLE